jgi:hypothetical protein
MGGEVVSAKRFTLMGYDDHGSWPTVRAVNTREPTEVMGAAKAMLESVAYCVRVEIWAGRDLLHTLRHPG